MGLFSSSNKVDNSVRVSTVSDSYNTTSSFSQGFSDIGNTKVTLPQASTLEKLLPLLVVAVVMVGLIALKRRT